MRLLLTAAGVIAAWAIWTRYQFVRWSDTAGVIADRQMDLLKQMSFESLAQRAGQAHELRSEVVDGHAFLIGWQADWPGGFTMLDRDPAEGTVTRKSPEQGPNGEELEVRGFVDFVYPLVVTKRLHMGLAFRFTRRVDDADQWAV